MPFGMYCSRLCAVVASGQHTNMEAYLGLPGLGLEEHGLSMPTPECQRTQSKWWIVTSFQDSLWTSMILSTWEGGVLGNISHYLGHLTVCVCVGDGDSAWSHSWDLLYFVCDLVDVDTVIGCLLGVVTVPALCVCVRNDALNVKIYNFPQAGYTA